MEHASDHALAATAAGLLAAAWFGWTVRHSGPWTRVLPVAGAAAAAALATAGALTAVRAWSDGTVVTGGVVAIYAAALLVHAGLTRLCTGLLASRYRRAVAAAKDDAKAGVTVGKSRVHLIPTVVAVSTGLQLVVIADTLDVPALYLGGAAGVAVALLAWPLGWALRPLTRPRLARPTVALVHPLTGLLTGATLVATGLWVLLPAL